MVTKKVLVLGASGKIGRHLIRKLTKNNYVVTAVTRNLHQKGYSLKTQSPIGFLEIIDGKHDDLPEQAFYMVGGIEEAVAKAEEMNKQIESK